MVRKGLIVAALLAASSPLAAQEEWVWSSDRPDGATSLAVMGARTLSAGEVQVQYQWIQRNYEGVWEGETALSLESGYFDRFDVAPVSLVDRRHSVQVGIGLSDRFTVRARGEFALLERTQCADEPCLSPGVDTGTFFVTTANGLGDLHVDATYNLIQSGPYRLDVNAGAIVPIGESETQAVTPFSSGAEEATPYDMRPGAGSIGLVGAISVDAQNEVGSVGAQFKGRTYLDENSAGFTLGDRYELNGWAAYVVTDNLGFSAGARWERWGNIDGGDSDLAGMMMRDPMNNGIFLGGSRVSMPLGVNFLGSDGSVIEGHHLSLEALWVLHHDYDGPQLALDWGLNVGYAIPF